MDGWNYQNKNNTLDLTSTGLHWYNSVGSGAIWLQQLLNYSSSSFLGKYITCSILLSSGALSQVTIGPIVMDQNNDSYISLVGSSAFFIRCYFNSTTLVSTFTLRRDNATFDMTIQAIKLELGDQQTLAHQENGVWVLNEVPDYEYELYRCKTSTADPSDTYANKVLSTNLPNKNLLDNWYFVGGGSQQGGGQLPINQRGQTSYSLGYSIDRWIVNTGSTLTFASDGVHISAGGTYKQFYQLLENPAALANRTLTLSMLITSASVLPYAIVYKDTTTEIFRERIESPGLYVKTFTTDSNGVASVRLNGLSYVPDYTIQAMKLEIGTEQTLCHNEGTAEAPVWVLNEVPDYEYELYRCMTSTADSADTYANKTLATGQEIAYVENGTTASRAYAVGEYFCWHGSLYKAKTAIGNGDTFTENTNCEQVTEGGLNALKSCLSWKPLGIAYNDTPLNTNFASYNELLIRPLVNGSVQYGTYVTPVANFSSSYSLFLSIYESQTHHASLQITTNSAKTQISLAYNGAIAGWNSVAVGVSAR